MGIEDWLEKEETQQANADQPEAAPAPPKPESLIRLALFSIVGALLFGGIYGFWCQWTKGLRFACVMVVLAGVMVGSSVAQGAKAGNILDRKRLGIWSLVAGLVGIYANWVIWIWAISGHKLVVWTPQGILETLAAVAHSGAPWVDVAGQVSTVDPVQQYIFWGTELVVFMVSAWCAARGRVSFSKAFFGIMRAIGVAPGEKPSRGISVQRNYGSRRKSRR